MTSCMSWCALFYSIYLFFLHLFFWFVLLYSVGEVVIIRFWWYWIRASLLFNAERGSCKNTTRKGGTCMESVDWWPCYETRSWCDGLDSCRLLLCILCRWLFLFEVLNVRCAPMWHGFFLSLCYCHYCALIIFETAWMSMFGLCVAW